MPYLTGLVYLDGHTRRVQSEEWAKALGIKSQATPTEIAHATSVHIWQAWEWSISESVLAPKPPPTTEVPDWIPPPPEETGHKWEYQMPTLHEGGP